MLSALHFGRFLLPRKISGTHFCQRLSRPQGHSAVGRIRSIENSSHIIRNRTRDFRDCSTMPQPTTLPHAANISCWQSGTQGHKFSYSEAFERIGQCSETPDSRVQMFVCISWMSLGPS
jgi:hypothetical protein